MDLLTATPAAPPPAEHGEGPTWDDVHGRLLWVDLERGLVRRSTVAGDGGIADVAVDPGGDTVGAVVPAAAGGWLMAAGGGFSLLTEDGKARVLVTLSDEGGTPEGGGTRMNDAACDPAGRFLAGTMAFDERAGAGRLYCLDLDGTVRTLLEDTTVTNGSGWSPDGRTLYLADSGPGVVWAFDYDVDAGTISGQRALLEFDGGHGVADGLTVDDEGCLWTAMWGGGAVRRWSPDGDELAVVEVAAAQTSSCAFAGPDRDVLVISTSRRGLDERQRASSPDAGRLFTVRPGVTGPAASVYRGPLAGLRQL
jgi:sugar lactone lactonase YvrE